MAEAQVSSSWMETAAFWGGMVLTDRPDLSERPAVFATSGERRHRNFRLLAEPEGSCPFRRIESSSVAAHRRVLVLLAAVPRGRFRAGPRV